MNPESSLNDHHEELLLYYASRNRWPKAIECLVKRVPHINKKYVVGEIALDATSSRGHLEVVECLMEKGTDIYKKMISQAASYEASSAGHLEVVKFLVKKGSYMKVVPDFNARYSGGETALLRATINGHVEVVKCLMDEGADINIRDNVEETALHKALKYKHLEIVYCLVERGADINMKNSQGVTPLLYAAENDKKALVDLFLYHGANVDISCHNFKRTLLHYASVREWIDIVEFLINKGCDLDAKDISGNTALHYACLMGIFDIAQHLFQAGASWCIENYYGRSPLNCLTRQSPSPPALHFIKLLIGNGAYLKPIDYHALVKNLLQDKEFCCQVILNKFNNHNLPELYKLPASVNLPRIEKMKIVNGSEVAEAIERTVGFEIETKGQCNIFQVRPIPLKLLSVTSVLKYYEKKSALELMKHLSVRIVPAVGLQHSKTHKD